MPIDQIKKIIESHVPNATVYIMDPMKDGQHLQAIVVSPAFQGMMLVKQHQMVMGPLKEALAGEVHALGLKTFTPSQWEMSKDRFRLV